jgi:hypothetical protein
LLLKNITRYDYGHFYNNVEFDDYGHFYYSAEFEALCTSLGLSLLATLVGLILGGYKLYRRLQQRNLFVNMGFTDDGDDSFAETIATTPLMRLNDSPDTSVQTATETADVVNQGVIPLVNMAHAGVVTQPGAATINTTGKTGETSNPTKKANNTPKSPLKTTPPPTNRVETRAMKQLLKK